MFWAMGPLLCTAPEAPTRRVVVLPGFGCDDFSTVPLRLVLGGLGHDVTGWGLGTNIGPTADVLSGMAQGLRQAVDSAGQTVILVGWSLGGLLARDLARSHPALIDQVISLGSPISHRPTDLSAMDPFGIGLQRRGGVGTGRTGVRLRPLRCPSTAIFTRTDGIVPGESCRQRSTQQAENVEVWGSHSALLMNVPAAYVIADRLAQTRDHWSPFRPPAALSPLYP